MRAMSHYGDLVQATQISPWLGLLWFREKLIRLRYGGVGRILPDLPRHFVITIGST
jgi:hypothetical protein